MDTAIDQTGTAIGPHGIASATAKETVLVANTPSFLLDRLRKDSAVQYVLDNMRLPEIVQSLRAGLANPPSDPTSLVALYIYLVALAATDPQDQQIWGQIKSLDLSRLEWGNVIRNLISVDAIPTTTMEFTLSSPIKP
jgi:hypothetical protein